MSLICDGTLSQSNEGYPTCSGPWLDDGQNVSQLLQNVVNSLDSLNSNLNDVFNFNVEVFGIVLLASILSFIAGHVLGVVTRMLYRT